MAPLSLAPSRLLAAIYCRWRRAMRPPLERHAVELLLASGDQLPPEFVASCLAQGPRAAEEDKKFWLASACEGLRRGPLPQRASKTALRLFFEWIGNDPSMEQRRPASLPESVSGRAIFWPLAVSLCKALLDSGARLPRRSRRPKMASPRPLGDLCWTVAAHASFPGRLARDVAGSGMLDSRLAGAAFEALPDSWIDSWFETAMAGPTLRAFLAHRLAIKAARAARIDKSTESLFRKLGFDPIEQVARAAARPWALDDPWRWPLPLAPLDSLIADAARVAGWNGVGRLATAACKNRAPLAGGGHLPTRQADQTDWGLAMAHAWLLLGEPPSELAASLRGTRAGAALCALEIDKACPGPACLKAGRVL